MIRRLCCIGALAVGLLALSAPTAGAATSPTSPPETWVSSVCSALEKYQQTYTDESASFTTAVSSVKDLKQARATIVKFLATMVATAKTAKAQVQDAGTPSLANGEKIAEGLVKALDDSQRVFAKAKAKAARISVKSPAAFKKQGTKVGTDLQNAAAGVQNGVLQTLTLDTSGQLQTAALAAPECAFITSQ